MAYKPYNPYSSERESNILRILPFVLAAILLALMGWAGYRGYQSVKPRPKPAEITYAPHVGNIGTVWLRCNAGMDVTDLRDCPEYAPSLQAFKERVSERDAWYEAAGVLLRHASRKDKALAATAWEEGREESLKQWDPQMHSTLGIDLGQAWSQRPRKHKRKHNRGAYGTEGGDTSGNLWLVNHPWDTKPVDITRLMEQIAPTQPTVGHCPDGTLTSNGLCLDKPSVEQEYISRGMYGGDTVPLAKTGCVMPADIDVCPAQMLDPKASHD